MKIINFRAFVLFTTALVTIILLSKCKPHDPEKKCCEGFTGQLTNSQAQKLKRTCHFIDVDSILAWTNRYQENKRRNPGDNTQGLQGQPGIDYLLGDSSSYNSCIIRKIICNENSIGLRVVYGMTADKKIHVIFVGVKPDYTTLYIEEPVECCNSNTQLQNAAAGAPPGKLGGAEYGQLP